MKSLAFFALSAVAVAAMAGPQQTPNGQITISGTSTQTATINGGNVSNTANAGTFANQNIASNKGLVDISGTSTQTANLNNSSVTNQAFYGGDVAMQNLASNVGSMKDGIEVQAKGKSEQTANVKDSTVTNEAKSGSSCWGDSCVDAAFANQNLASNYGNVDIKGTSKQKVSVTDHSYVTNAADGRYSVAIQNLSSNYGNVSISGSSTQTTSVGKGAVVANWAGFNAHAVQNIASNDSCLPPPPLCTGPACGPYAFNQAPR